MKSNIMTSANLRASREGRSQALKNSHKASKGVFVGNGINVLTVKQQSRLYSNFKASDKVQDEVIKEFNVDMGMF